MQQTERAVAESNVKPEIWEWDEPSNWHSLDARVFIREPYGLIATVPIEAWRPRERGRSHARLIAAAPELLEALKDLLRDAQDRLTEVPDELYHRCREIINRAEGRS